MTPPDKFQIYNVIVVTGNYADEETEVALDPDVVKLSVYSPDGEVSTLIYPDDITKTGTGVYTSRIIVDQSGMWYYRWWSTGDGYGSKEDNFLVTAARAVEA